MPSLEPDLALAPPADLPPAPRRLDLLARAFALTPAQARLLWLIAAPALDMRALRMYRRRWPTGPWPDVRVACRMACPGQPFQAALLRRGLPASPLVRLGILRIATTGDRMTARVAPDVLRALDGRAPLLPDPLAARARLFPIGQAWRPAEQARLAACLARLEAGEAPWLCIDAAPDAGTLDALAAQRPTLCVDLLDADDCAAVDLTRVLRIARTRALLPLIRTRAATWARVCRAAEVAPPGLIVERPPSTAAPPPSALRFVSRPLDRAAREAVWRAEVDPPAARWLAARHAIGRALIQSAVDALRLQGVALTPRALDAEVIRRRRAPKT